MTPDKSTRSKSNSKISKLSKPKQPKIMLQPIQSLQNQLLGPIYDKVDLIRQQLNRKQPLQGLVFQDQAIRPETREVFIEIGIDRNQAIENARKKHELQQQTEKNRFKAMSSERKISTSMNWRENNRNRTKSLVNFLQNNKVNPLTYREKTAQTKKSRISVIEKQAENQQLFQPVGRLYQQSIRGSETQSLSSFRPESSLQLSKIRSINSKDSPRKYLRKGTRVRQILMKQLQSAEQRSGTPSSMTYLKDYDQWVPTSFVEEKKAELQIFMNIIYGDKKSKGSTLVDLNQIHLVYL